MAVTDAYIDRLMGMQTRLNAYILAILADMVATDDVLQETNLVLYSKAHEFTEGTNFERWAFRIARIQCLAYWTLRGRDRLVLDDQTIFEHVDPVKYYDAEMNFRRDALNECLEKLPLTERKLVEDRYSLGTSVTQLAKVFGRTEPAISQLLYRIRAVLARCIRMRLAEEGPLS